MSRIAYVNGKYVSHSAATVHIDDRGMQFADSVYEAFAVVDGDIADEAGHVDRLMRSLGEVGIDMPVSRRAFGLIARELLRRNRIANAKLYVQVTRGQAPRELRIPAGLRPGLIMTVRPVCFDLGKRKIISKKVMTMPDIRWARRDIKTTMLLPQVLARQAAAEKGVDDVWLTDPKGFVTEALGSNAWIVDKSGALITHPVDRKLLKGVTRTVVRAMCKKEKIKLIERPFTPREAYKAKEAFTSAAFSLFVSVVEIDGHRIGDGKPGPMMKKLYDMYFDYLSKGKAERWSAE
jgi:D-alanine transaminase